MFIWRISWPSLNHKNKYPANIIHVPRQLTRPELTANINPRKHGFVWKAQTLIPANINEFTVLYLTTQTIASYSIWLILKVDKCVYGCHSLRYYSSVYNYIDWLWYSSGDLYQSVKHKPCINFIEKHAPSYCLCSGHRKCVCYKNITSRYESCLGMKL